MTPRLRAGLGEPLATGATLSLIGWVGYVVGFLSLGFRPLDAAEVAAVHVVPAAVLGALAWSAQPLVRARHGPRRWLAHGVLAVGYGLAWAGTLYALTLAFAPPAVVEKLKDGILAWTTLLGVVVYVALASTWALIAARRQVLEREAAAVSAELAALRASVEPHFLYNALEGIAGLVRTNPDAAEEAIARLGTALRRLLGRDAEGGSDAKGPDADGLVALAEELALLRDTLFVERLRMGDRLRVVERVSAETLDLAVPPLTLQPLVENAIKHGLTPRPRGGVLSLAARREGDMLVLEVADDGEGAEEAALADAPGLGLGLLRRRLAAHYGDGARLDVAAALGRGVSVRVALPAREAHR